MKILFKFPSRSRPEKFFACIENIIEMARHDDYSIQATLDADDSTMTTDEVKERISLYPNVKAFWGLSKNKIDAINRDMEFSGEWDVVCVHSDDFWIDSPGFDKSIVENMQKFFPDTDGVLHYPDQKAGNRLITYSILGRKYFERRGHLYNTCYDSVYADNEFTDISKLLGKYQYIPERRITHRHSIWGWGPPDELLLKTEDKAVYAKDHQTYINNKDNNFYL